MSRRAESRRIEGRGESGDHSEVRRGPNVLVHIEFAGTGAVLQLAGEFDLASRDVLDRSVDDVLARQPAAVDIDLSTARLLDVGAVRAIERCCLRVRSTGGTAAVLRPPELIRRVLDLMGVDHHA